MTACRARRLAAASFAALAAPVVSAATFEGTLEAVVRDFCFVPIAGACAAHPDFESNTGGGEKGIVAPTLGADAKPDYAKGDGSTSPSTSGEANFDQWYRDVPGVNSRTTLTLDNQASDPEVFSYSADDFFPVDDALFGNQGLDHNFHFTLELHTRFEFVGDEFFTFRGDDDLWVFINDRLAIDLGGVHPTQTDTIDLSLSDVQSELGVTPGETYTLDLFFAERHTTNSTFEISTDLGLAPVPLPAAAWLLLSALGAVAVTSRGRKKGPGRCTHRRATSPPA